MTSLQQANSQVNFESAWSTGSSAGDKEHKGLPLLRDKRVRRFHFDQRSIAQVATHISRRKELRRRVVRPHVPRVSPITGEVELDLGMALSSLSFAEAKQVFSACNIAQEKLLMRSLLANPNWEQTALGKVLAVRIAKVGREKFFANYQ
ncbi:MAG: hypothetical protein OYH77_06735 [Pseudomonadota bacterium]|nr:hypothetical protein [Pseudomonadota bacterium]